MGQIISVASSKGGVGKSTLTLFLAANLAAHGRNVCAIDADANAALTAYHRLYAGPPFTVIGEVDHIGIVARIMTEASRHDIVLIDCAGFLNVTAAAAMSASDYVLVPTTSDRPAVVEAGRSAQQVASLGARRRIGCGIVLNQWAREAADTAALDSLQAAGLPVLRQRIPRLTVFRQASYSGVVPVSGRIGLVFDGLIAELAADGAIPVI